MSDEQLEDYWRGVAERAAELQAPVRTPFSQPLVLPAKYEAFDDSVPGDAAQPSRPDKTPAPSRPPGGDAP